MKTRFLLAEQVCASLISAELFPYSPIVHCHEMAQRYALPTAFEFWKRYNMDMLRRADQFFILDILGWKESIGVTAEHDFARRAGIPCFMCDTEGGATPCE